MWGQCWCGLFFFLLSSPFPLGFRHVFLNMYGWSFNFSLPVLMFVCQMNT